MNEQDVVEFGRDRDGDDYLVDEDDYEPEYDDYDNDDYCYCMFCPPDGGTDEREDREWDLACDYE